MEVEENVCSKVPLCKKINFFLALKFFLIQVLSLRACQCMNQVVNRLTRDWFIGIMVANICVSNNYRNNEGWNKRDSYKFKKKDCL